MTTAAPKLDIQHLKIVPLRSSAAFDGFSCGEHEIDRNLSKCCEWHETHRARVFCAYINDEPTLYGFYCVGQHAHGAASVGSLFRRSSDDTRAYVPFIYLNYLAVRDGWRRQKIGTILLMNALERCAVVTRNIGSYGVALKALTDDAVAFYDHFKFRAVDDSQKYPFMVLPAQSVLGLIPPQGEFAT